MNLVASLLRRDLALSRALYERTPGVGGDSIATQLKWAETVYVIDEQELAALLDERRAGPAAGMG